MHTVLNQWVALITAAGIDGTRLELLSNPRKAACVDGVWRIALHDYIQVIHVHEHSLTRRALATIGDVRLGAALPTNEAEPAEYYEISCGLPCEPQSSPDGLFLAEVQPRRSGPEVTLDELEHAPTTGLRMVRTLLASMEVAS